MISGVHFMKLVWRVAFVSFQFLKQKATQDYVQYHELYLQCCKHQQRFLKQDPRLQRWESENRAVGMRELTDRMNLVYISSSICKQSSELPELCQHATHSSNVFIIHGKMLQFSCGAAEPVLAGDKYYRRWL